MSNNLTKRERIYARDGNACLNCGSPDDLTLDHILPLSRGGSNDESNLQTLCGPCNFAKGSKYPCPYAGEVGRRQARVKKPEPCRSPEPPKEFVPRPRHSYHSSRGWTPKGKRRKALVRGQFVNSK